MFRWLRKKHSSVPVKAFKTLYPPPKAAALARKGDTQLVTAFPAHGLNKAAPEIPAPCELLELRLDEPGQGVAGLAPPLSKAARLLPNPRGTPPAPRPAGRTVARPRDAATGPLRLAWTCYATEER